MRRLICSGETLGRRPFRSTVLYTKDPVMTLTQFMARSTWVAHAFEWEKLLKCHLKGKIQQEIGKLTEY